MTPGMLTPLQTDWGPIATVLAAIILLLGTWLTLRASRQDKKIDVTAKNYDQLQEDLTAIRGELTTAKAQILSLQQVDRLKDNYIANLRDHIYQGKPPPPPPWPEELTRQP